MAKLSDQTGQRGVIGPKPEDPSPPGVECHRTQARRSPFDRRIAVPSHRSGDRSVPGGTSREGKPILFHFR